MAARKTRNARRSGSRGWVAGATGQGPWRPLAFLAVVIVALYATTLFAVVLPLKIWNNTRNENKLEQQQRLLMQARLGGQHRRHLQGKRGPGRKDQHGKD